MAIPGSSNSHGCSSCCGSLCSACVRAVKWMPVVFILAILLWSYYVFVLQLCLNTLDYLSQQIIYLILYHILFIMFLWAYFKTIFTRAARVPPRFRLPQGEIERLIQCETQEMQNTILEMFCHNLPVLNRTNGGARRYCEKCRHIKPDRSHHCSVCGECILKMDHHCPWVNNCVCYSNYKFFVLFLGYALLYCLFISVTSVQYFIAFWRKHRPTLRDLGSIDGMGRFHILFLFFVAVMFAISLASLFVYHMFLISSNRTTLEAFRPPIFQTGADKYGWHLGTRKNFIEVFGSKPKLWFLPVFSTSGDGVIYPVRAQPPSGSYQTMENSQTSLGDGISYEKYRPEEDMEGLLHDVRCDNGLGDNEYNDDDGSPDS